MINSLLDQLPPPRFSLQQKTMVGISKIKAHATAGTCRFLKRKAVWKRTFAGVQVRLGLLQPITLRLAACCW